MTTQTVSATWHYGLMARWWAEFNHDDTPGELEFFRSGIQTFGQPALDLGCGTGRILIPLRQEGIDVDGCDVSGDMLDQCRLLLERARIHTGGLFQQPMAALDPPRRYRTIYICGSIGLGGSREDDREMLRRVFDHLEPGGALLFDLYLPYASYGWWGAWTPEKRTELPWEWKPSSERKPASNGEELELTTRLFALDPLEQRITLQARLRLWRDDQLVTEEFRDLTGNEYLHHEMLLLLEAVGFVDVTVTGGHSTARTPTPDDTILGFTARKPV